MNSQTQAQQNIQVYEMAKQAFLKIHAETSRWLLQQEGKLDFKPNKGVSNAQYFVHELYYYLGFQPKEIAVHTGINLVTILGLLTNDTTTLSRANFKKLVYLYCACAQSKILPKADDAELSKLDTIREIKAIDEELKKAVFVYMATCAEPEFRRCIQNLSLQEFYELIHNNDAVNH